MLEKFLNKKVFISVAGYAMSINCKSAKGTITKIDENFIELDNDEVIAIKYIISIKSI